MAINNQSIKMNAMSFPVADDVTIANEGTVLVYKYNTTTEDVEVEPSAGASGEVFAGFAAKDYAIPTKEVVVDETKTVPASSAYEVQLDHVNLESGSLRVEAGGTNLTLITSGSPTSSQVKINYTTGLLTFNSAAASATLWIAYRRTLSADEATLKRDQVNHKADTVLQIIGVLQGPGEIQTDQYTVANDWHGTPSGGQSDPIAAYTGANGLLTTDNTGALCGYVVKGPTTDNPFVTLRAVAS